MNDSTPRRDGPEGVCRTCRVVNWQRPPHVRERAGLWFCGGCGDEYEPHMVLVVSKMVRRIVGSTVEEEAHV